jgi:hypothetical protein
MCLLQVSHPTIQTAAIQLKSAPIRLAHITRWSFLPHRLLAARHPSSNSATEKQNHDREKAAVPTTTTNQRIHS